MLRTVSSNKSSTSTSTHTVSTLGDKVEQRSMFDLILVRGNRLRDVYNVKTIKAISGGMSDHRAVLCNLKLVDSKRTGRIDMQLLVSNNRKLRME